MNDVLLNDLQNLDNLLDQTSQQSLTYLQEIEERTTSTNHIKNDQNKLPYKGIGAKKALELFNHSFEPMIVASSGPRYWGYVTGGSTPASIVGDWLASIYDQNTQNVKGEGDISANIELETINLLLDLFELPKEFLGGFVTGATMSNFTCLAAARQWIGKQKGIDIAKQGVQENLNILAATPHSSVIKSLAMLGLGSTSIIQVNTLEGNREAISIDDLEEKIQALEDDPFILITSGGTVNTVDFDDFTAISKLQNKYNFWWHIDAAFGGFAACSDQYRHLLKDWDKADSITVDCHKWLNVPYESAVFFIREEHKLLQTETFQNSNAPYLGDPLDKFNYLNFLPENSRRLKALPAWFSIMAYGKNGYRDIVDHCVYLAQLFGEKIEENSRLELLAPVRLNNLCFTLKGDENQEKVGAFLHELNKAGKVFMTSTFFNGIKGIRASLVNWRTSERDLEIVIDEIFRVFDTGLHKLLTK